MSINRYTVLGISAGQGALLFPFRKHLLGNIEPRGVFHTPREEQWKANFGDIPFYKGYCLQEFDEKVDIIISSPDCGASSIMRLSKVKELGKPKDNRNLNLVIEGINYYKPKIFLIENLPRLLSLLPNEYIHEAFKDYKLIFMKEAFPTMGTPKYQGNV